MKKSSFNKTIKHHINIMKLLDYSMTYNLNMKQAYISTYTTYKIEQ